MGKAKNSKSKTVLMVWNVEFHKEFPLEGYMVQKQAIFVRLFLCERESKSAIFVVNSYSLGAVKKMR